MIRDMDLIRQMLIAIRDNTSNPDGFYLASNCVPGVDPTIIRHHLILMEEAGLFGGNGKKANDTSGAYFVQRLSNRGHDFLENIRNDKVWEKTKKEIEKKQLPRTFTVIAELAGYFVGGLMKSIMKSNGGCS